MRVKRVVAIIALTLCSYSGMAFSQDCNEIDGFSSASGKFRLTGGDACENYATLDYSFRYTNGELTIEWGTSNSFGQNKSVYESKPIRLEGLEPNTTYHFKIWGFYKNRNHEYGTATFTTSGGAPANELPTITSDDAVSCTTETSVTYTITADDPDDDAITFSAEDLPEWISLEGATLTFEPTSESADTEVKIIASDGKEGFDTLDLAVTVVHVVGVFVHQNNSQQPVTLSFGTMRLNVPAAYGKPLEVALYSLNGSRIIQRSLKVVDGMNYGGLLPEGIVPGVYIVKVNSIAGTGTYTIGIRE